MSASKPASIRVGILVFDQVEVLDFAGPFEVFSAVRLDESVRRESKSPFEVVLVSPDGGEVTASGGLRVGVDHGLESCPGLDLLVIPGGWGTRALLDDARLIAWIASRRQTTSRVATVCTGALLAGKAGLLNGRRATTHWKSLELIQAAHPEACLVRDRHFVVEPDFASSAGISAGIDLALRLVADHLGEAISRATARHMEYPWPDSDVRRVVLEPGSDSQELRIEATVPDYHRIAALYSAAALRRPVRDQARMECMFRGSNVVHSAWVGSHLVGLLRGWTDGAFDGFVSDLAIHPDYQGQGVGKALLACLDGYGAGIQWTLHASPLALEYYGKAGWTIPSAPWTRLRQGAETRDPKTWQQDHLDLAAQA